jgi:release factor glutamine methyltransferase
MNSKKLFTEIVSRITLPETDDEIRSIVYLAVQKVFGISKTQILSGFELTVSESQRSLIEDYINRINQHEPIQYIVGEELFYGRLFSVKSSVLIPRPETENLIDVVKDFGKKKEQLTILDIGTGSGCIGITLSLEINSAKVFATDVSDTALEVARDNAKRLNTNVTFINHDILKEAISFSKFDVIVSNPPYIAVSEKSQMQKNVTEFEPHVALFVNDNDPLLFYKAIVARAKQSLSQNGMIALEINERFGNEVAELLSKNNFANITILKDLSGKDRIVTAFLARTS